MAMANGGGGGSRVREREQGERRRARESESGAGQLRGFVRGIEGDEKGTRQAGREEVALRVRARLGHTPLSYCPEEEDDREALAGWAGQGGGELGRLVGCAGEAR